MTRVNLLAATLFFSIAPVVAPFASAQTTQPAGADSAAAKTAVTPDKSAVAPDRSELRAVELRANQAFAKGDYSVAMPMLQKVADDLKADPSRSQKLAMVEEQIRVCQKNQPAQNQPVQVASAVTSTGTAAAAPGVPAGPSTAVGERKVHPAPKAGEVQEMAIKELGNFDYDAEKNSPIPDDVKALSGSSIRLHGFMIPMDSADSISKFALVPSLFACCYGQPPQMQHTIVVNCPKGKAVSYFNDEIVVEGKLKVEVVKDDGFVVNIFTMEATSVKPAAK